MLGADGPRGAGRRRACHRLDDDQRVLVAAADGRGQRVDRRDHVAGHRAARRHRRGRLLQPVQVADHLHPVAVLLVGRQVAPAQPPGVPRLGGEPHGLPRAPGELLEHRHPWVVAVAAAVAQHQQRRTTGDGRAVLLEELLEGRAVVGVRVDVEHPAGGGPGQHHRQRVLDAVLGEQVGDLDEVLDEREAAHLGGDGLQAVHQVQREAGGGAHREGDVAEHQQPRPVLDLAHRHRAERHAVVLHVRAHRAPAVDHALGGDRALGTRRAVQAPQQPAQRLLEVGALGLVKGLGAGRLELAGLDLLLHRQQLLEVVAQPLGEPLEQRRQGGTQGGDVLRHVDVGLVGQVVGQPVEQRHLLGDAQLGVDLQAGAGRQVAGVARVAHPVGGELDPGRLAPAVLSVVGQHDLVGERGHVEAVGLLVQVVLLGHVLGVEVLLEVAGLAVRVALLRVVARVVREGELLELAVVGEVVVGVGVAVLLLGQDRLEPEEPVEDPVERLDVAAVLDQRRGQRRAQQLTLGEHSGLRGRAHGVDRLRDADPHPAQAQQPDEPVQCSFHLDHTGRLRAPRAKDRWPFSALTRCGPPAHRPERRSRLVVPARLVLGGPLRRGRPRRRRRGCARGRARGRARARRASPGRWRSGRPGGAAPRWPGAGRARTSRPR